MAHLSSLRSIVLCAVLAFSTNVLAASAVLGVDLGTEFIKAALVKPGIPLEIVLTKDSRRKETAAVAFKPLRNSPASGDYPERAYGSDAIALAARFPHDVYPNLKTLLALPVQDDAVVEYLARHPALQLEAHKTRGTAAFKSKATAKEDAWLVEELLAMELQSIQRNAEALAGPDTSVRSAVITVPPFYTTEEKRAVKAAAELVGLKVLSLISDGMAVGLNYATSRTFPTVNAHDGGKPEINMVFDMGAGSTKATIMKFQGRSVKDVGKFNKTVQVVQAMGSGWDRSAGGDHLNYLIVDDMIAQFVDSADAKKAGVTAEGVKSHGRAMAKLLKEAQRLRQVLSAIQDAQGSFEGLYQDVDFKYKITRAHFEKLAESCADRVRAAVQQALDMAELDIKQIDSIILHGGASRTPFVQKELEKIAGADKIRSNVNSDESAVFGAGFKAADLSPSFRVKEIRTVDVTGYAIGIKYTDDQSEPQQQRLWTERSAPGAVSKEVTFSNNENFDVQFYQEVPSANGLVEKGLKTVTTKNLTASAASLVLDKGCAKADIQFKFQARMNSVDGEIEVAKARVQCEIDAPKKEGVLNGVKNLFGFGKDKDQQPLGEDESSDSQADSTTASTDTASTSSVESTSTSSADTTSSATESTETAESTPEPPQKTLVSIPVSFTVELAGSPQLTKSETTKAKDRIKAFETSDKARRAREEALNQLEAFSYKIRDVLDTESFEKFSTEEERESLRQKSGDARDWLEDEGENATKDQFKAKLKDLKELVAPIDKRIAEAESRPDVVKSMREALDTTKTLMEKIKLGLESHSSPEAASSSSTTEANAEATEAPSDGESEAETTTSSAPAPAATPFIYSQDDLEELEEIAKSTSEWLEEKLAAQEALPDTADPALKSKDVLERTSQLKKVAEKMALKVKKSQKKAQESMPDIEQLMKMFGGAGGAGGAEGMPDIAEMLKKMGGDGAGGQPDIAEMLKKMQEGGGAEGTKEGAEEAKADGQGEAKPEGEAKPDGEGENKRAHEEL